MKRRLFKLTAFFTSAILLLGVLAFTITPVMAASTAIYLEPSNSIYTNSTANVGTLFNVSVLVSDAPDLGGVQVYMEFNDSQINVTRWIEPTFNSSYIFNGTTTSALPTPPDPGYKHISAGKARVLVAVNRFPPQAPWGHSGLICIFEFNITAVPTTPGTMLNCSLNINSTKTFLLDPTGSEVANVVEQNGYYEISKPGGPPPPVFTLTIVVSAGGSTNPAAGAYSYAQGSNVSVQATPYSGYQFDHWELDTVNVGSANSYSVTMNSNCTLNALFSPVIPPPPGNNSRIFVDPPEIIDPTAVPGTSTFEVNVTVQNMTQMMSCEFNMTYNSGIIGFNGINFLKVSGQFPALNLSVTEPSGFVWIRLAYTPAVTVTDPTPIVTIRFVVRNLGATPINLTNTAILDPLGNPLPSYNVSHGFFMSLIRDVAVINVVPSQNWAYQGWPVNVTVTVKNKGNVTETFNVSSYYDSTLIGKTNVTALAPGDQRDVLFQWDTTGVSEGNYTIKAVADAVPYQFNASDLTLTDGVVWIMTQIHDVAITSITRSNDWVYQGWIAGINVTAENEGAFNETFDISAYAGIMLIGTVSVSNLAPSALFTAQFSLNTSSLQPCHNYTIMANATLVPYEYNVTNNVLVDGGIKVRLLGDANGDGTIDLKDVYAVSLAYGSAPGYPNWNPDCDLNQDQVVDLRDFYIVVKNYGQSCNP